MDSVQNRKPKVLIMGTFHMGQTGDVFQLEQDNLLTEKRQKEIEEVCDRIKPFSPTKIAVEVDKKRNQWLNDKYERYLKNTYELEQNEVYQIGFRLAKALKHKEVYSIDWMEKGVATKNAGDISNWLKENLPEMYTELFGWLEEKIEADKINKEYKTILEQYREVNDRLEIKNHHSKYVNYARVKNEEEFIGLEWLLWWYQRNLILFSNLADLVTKDEERILFIVGSAHVQIVSNFCEESGLFELESIENYLR